MWLPLSKAMCINSNEYENNNVLKTLENIKSTNFTLKEKLIAYFKNLKSKEEC